MRDSPYVNSETYLAVIWRVRVGVDRVRVGVTVKLVYLTVFIQNTIRI